MELMEFKPATYSSKRKLIYPGKVYIPKEIREQLNYKDDQEVVLMVNVEERAILVKAC